MDFHSLARRELQSLCKLNKIPANVTNIAMADALKSLEIVQGIEEVLNLSQSETAGLGESTEKVEVSSPRAPQTRCRTSTRQKVKIMEAENLPPTATRTTRRGSKQLAGEVEETKNDMLKTPAMASTRRKALATSSCRNVNSQLNECKEEANKEGLVDLVSPAAVVMNSRRKGATASTHGATVKKESTMQKTYSTRRSTRLTEKKSAEPRVRKESEEAVKFISFVDEVNVTSKDVSGKPDEVPENAVGSGNPNADLEDICNAFGKLDVLVEKESAPISVLENAVNIEAAHKNAEKADCGELDNLKPESDETSNPCEDGDLEEEQNVGEKFDLGEEDSSKVKNDEVYDLKPDSDGISSPCEKEDLEENIDLGEEKLDASEVSSKEISGDKLSPVKDHNFVVVPERSYSLLNNNADLESGAAGTDDIDVDAIPFNTENLSGRPELGQEDMFCAVSKMKNQVPESNGSSAMMSDVILCNNENATEASKSDNENNFSAVDEITTKDMEEVSKNMDDETYDVIPTTDNLSTMTGEVQDLKPELFPESNVNEKASSPQNLNYAEPADADSAEVTLGFEGSIRVDYVSSLEEKNQFCVYPAPCLPTQNPSILSEVIGHPTRVTPIKKTLSKTPTSFKNTTIVSDDKENIDSGRKVQIVFEDEEKKSKKEKDENEKLMEISLRQLRKQVKKLTLKNNTNEDASKDAITRPALQALCGNQLAADEIKN